MDSFKIVLHNEKQHIKTCFDLGQATSYYAIEGSLVLRLWNNYVMTSRTSTGSHRFYLEPWWVTFNFTLPSMEVEGREQNSWVAACFFINIIITYSDGGSTVLLPSSVLMLMLTDMSESHWSSFILVDATWTGPIWKHLVGTPLY